MLPLSVTGYLFIFTKRNQRTFLKQVTVFFVFYDSIFRLGINLVLKYQRKFGNRSFPVTDSNIEWRPMKTIDGTVSTSYQILQNLFQIRVTLYILVIRKLLELLDDYRKKWKLQYVGKYNKEINIIKNNREVNKNKILLSKIKNIFCCQWKV